MREYAVNITFFADIRNWPLRIYTPYSRKKVVNNWSTQLPPLTTGIIFGTPLIVGWQSANKGKENSGLDCGGRTDSNRRPSEPHSEGKCQKALIY